MNCLARSIPVWARSSRRWRLSGAVRWPSTRIELAKAGVFVSIDADGTMLVERGHVRPEDEATEEPEAEIIDPETGAPAGRTGSQPTSARSSRSAASPPSRRDTDTIKPLPDRLVSELTAHRTLALRDAVAVNPHVAITALLHRLVTSCFLPHFTKGCPRRRSARCNSRHRPGICATAPQPRRSRTGMNAGAIISRPMMRRSGIGWPIWTTDPAWTCSLIA